MSADRPTDDNVEIRVEDDRTGMHPVTLERAVFDHLFYTSAKDRKTATTLDVYNAVANAARDRLVHKWLATQRTYYDNDVKRAYYLSAEFLLGRLLLRNLTYLGLEEVSREILAKYDIRLEDVIESETDPGLGNGGLGRLAACFLDSMATLQLPAFGYGIRYEFGIFEQHFEQGWQVERGDAWLRFGCPWEIPRHEYTVPVSFYGRVEEYQDDDETYRVRWVDSEKVMGVPYDTPCPGYGNNTVNTLRLWSARASKEFNFAVFNDGDYRRAVEEKSMSESISKVLYPNDRTYEGRELRLKQQYFFVACSIHDIVRRFKKTHTSFDEFPDKVAIQLNDTHPAIAVAELMRVLLDNERLPWSEAWDITQRTTAFTNHTLLAEALEKWPVVMFERLLPRHLKIIFEINHRFLRQVHIFAPNDHERAERMSIIGEGEQKVVRMAHLAVVGSHSVNGVAAIHSELIKTQLMPDFYGLFPERFNNKTNGVTPRRWLMLSNPKLAAAITARIGDGWTRDLDEMEGLEKFATDEDFLSELSAIKLANKEILATIIRDLVGLKVDPSSLFDVHIKRIHQYKRQLMNALHIISLYLDIKRSPDKDVVPRTFIFGGKAAPGYAMAKLHIKLINDIAEIVNADPAMRGRLKVVFIPNYGVSLAERIIPAADVSEQISMAGKEASGTGNMKFAMNGALTLGTLDGANIEIRDKVGAANFFLFGLDARQARELIASGYQPEEHIAKSAKLAEAIDLIASGFFSPEEPRRFAPVVTALRKKDAYLIGADFEDYVRAQNDVEDAYRNPVAWQQKVVHNLANVGTFSSDRTIRQYASEIWNVKPIKVEID